MMPVVGVNDATFVDLKPIAAWFGTNTPSATIDRIVRETMEQLGMERDDVPEAAPNRTSTGAMEFRNAPGLAFTKPLSAFVNGEAIRKPRWSAILLTMIAQVRAKGFEGRAVQRCRRLH